MNKRWTAEKAKQWGSKKPWRVGANFTPRTSINQLEMWQADTFDPDTIDQELSWAQDLGLNSMRVFLHDLPWKADADAFLERIDRFLEIANRHGIGTLLTIFDSCWHPFPRPGKQPEPEPGVHNSGWVQSPGVEILRDPAQFDLLRDYVVGVVSHFRKDARVDGWDLWNEPDNNNAASRGPRDIGNKSDVVAPLLERTFAWARSAKPSQPLTTGIWAGDWSSDAKLRLFERLQIELSDVISFHNYGPPDDLERRIEQLKRFDRPLLCTEYMARGSGSTFQACLPILKKHGVDAYNWGFVAGKTQTNYPWDSWQRAYGAEPPLWFHEIFRGDGKPYDPAETKVIRKMTAAS